MTPERFVHLRTVFYTRGQELRQNPVTKTLASKNPALAALLQELGARVERVEQRRRAAITAELTEAVVTVALAVLQDYQRMKRERAVLDYDDLILSTIALLEKSDAAPVGALQARRRARPHPRRRSAGHEPAAMEHRGKAGGGVLRRPGRARTRAAAHAVCRGRREAIDLQLPGRRSEAFGHHLRLFKTLAERAGLAFADLRPTVSRRSAVSVLDFVDAVFARDAARDGLTSSGDSIRHDPHRKEIGRVEVWPAEKAQKTEERDLWKAVDEPLPQSAQMILAARLAKRIRSWLDHGARCRRAARRSGPATS